MEMKLLKDRVNYLLDLANRALGSRTTDAGTVPRNRIDGELFAELRSGSLALILGQFGDKHPFYSDFDSQVRSAAPPDAERARGILRAVKAELELKDHL